MMLEIIHERLDSVRSWNKIPTHCLVFNIARVVSTEIRTVFNHPPLSRKKMAKAIDITTWRCSEKVAQSPTINYSAFRRLVGPEGLKRLKE
jgi:hypothetical protein